VLEEYAAKHGEAGTKASLEERQQLLDMVWGLLQRGGYSEAQARELVVMMPPE